MDFWELVAAIISGIAVCIPLAAKLCGYVSEAVREKSFRGLISLVIGLITQAEESFSTGAERKQWVIGMTKAAAEGIGYELESGELEKLIDALCEMSKHVNAGKGENT